MQLHARLLNIHYVEGDDRKEKISTYIFVHVSPLTPHPLPVQGHGACDLVAKLTRGWYPGEGLVVSSRVNFGNITFDDKSERKCFNIIYIDSWTTIIDGNQLGCKR